MTDSIPYLRVGTTYYKTIEKPTISGDKLQILTKWSRETIIHDHEKKYLSKIPKYDGFCCIPEHINYRKFIDGFYNLYNEIPFQPASGEIQKENIPFSINFMSHIFGEQLEFGLDYIKILLLYPTQILPILCLVSKERSTGKTTFIKWMKEVFGLNMTYIKGDSFGSQFNSDWASMLLVAIDEVFFDKKEITERLKYLSTTNKDKIEAKGKDRQEVNFFAKFVLCSNNELYPVIIDPGENRYWVRKIRPLESDDTNFLQRLKAEIPAFLHFLTNRELSTERESRMWFNPSLLHTEALQRIIRSNRNRLEIEMSELLLDIMATMNIDSVSFCLNDLVVLLMHSQVKAEKHQVRKVVQECWKLTPAPNGLTYTTYQGNYNRSCHYEPIKRVGRFYTVTREQLESL